ncbi:MAG: Uma2 family endonuclease [Chloroflexota bacterium]
MATTDTVDTMARSAPPRPADTQDTQSDSYLVWLREVVWPDRVERVGGVLLVSSAPVPEHQAALLDLGAWLREWAATTGAGEVLPGTELRLEGEGLPRPVRGRRPDNCVPDLLLYRFANQRCRRVPSGPRGVPAGYVEGAPDLVVEVRSPGTEDYDLREKRRAFARAGVPRYWVLDWTARTALVLSRPEEGDYREEMTVAWAELRWPPAGEPGSRRWGDTPTFPRLPPEPA